MQKFLHELLNHYSYFKLFGLGFLYFLFLYFAVGALFLAVCRFLARKNILNKIVQKEVGNKQKKSEVKHSLKSIAVFGFSIIPVVFLYRTGYITLLPDTFTNIALGIILLTLWNEIHFFVVHKIMHLPFFMKTVHYVHHASRVPTVYSVYSFHGVEAFLLSTVPLTIIPFLPFSIVAVFLFPLVSILFNFAGHCNYRFGTGKSKSWKMVGTRHNLHHNKGRNNFGFASDLLDKLFSSNRKK